MRALALGLAVSGALIAGWVVPALGMEALMPALEGAGPRVTNYRGRSIGFGLGAVWLLWGAGTALVAIGVQWFGTWRAGLGMDAPLTALDLGPLEVALGSVPLGLVVGAFALGLIDDVFGTGSDKGFRGHLRALARGRLTTGGLKMLGIGLLAAALTLPQLSRGAALGGVDPPGWVSVTRWVLAAITVALAANLVNLCDLRPARALKTHLVLAAAGVTAAAVWFANRAAAVSVRGVAVLTSPLSDTLTFAACVTALAVGPVLAVWRFDAGERAMLGDGGANAAGALSGFLIASHASLPWLAATAAVLAALNVASERVSFSRVIAGNALLRWIDALGRPRATGEVSDGADGAADFKEGTAEARTWPSSSS